jgi:hypothetical protein
VLTNDSKKSHFFKNNSTNSNKKTPFFSRPLVQTKLSIGQPGDKYEKEADAMADQVVQRLSETNAPMDQPEFKSPTFIQRKPIFESEADTSIQAKPISPTIQPKCESCEQEEKLEKMEEAGEEEQLQMKPIFDSTANLPDEDTVQRACSECAAEEEKVQLKSDGTNPPRTTPNLESRLQSSKGGGSPMPDNIRSQMEGAFGADFSGVRVHTDISAVQMNKDLGAQAFTHGNDIYFNSGKYDTDSKVGQQLLSHELTHTIQQTGTHVQAKNEIQAKQPKNEERGDDKPISNSWNTNNSINNNITTEDFPNEAQINQEVLNKETVDENQPELSIDEIENEVFDIPENGREEINRNNNQMKVEDSKNNQHELFEFDPSDINIEFEKLPNLTSLLKQEQEEEIYVQRIPENGDTVENQPSETEENASGIYTNRIQGSRIKIVTQLENQFQNNSEYIETNYTNIQNQISQRIQSKIDETKQKFSAARDHIDSSILNTELVLATNLSLMIEKTLSEGEDKKEEIRSIFDQHEQSISDTVSEKISSSIAVRDHYVDQMDNRVAEQISQANSRGRSKAASYPNTERGQKQRGAVIKVANDTSREMLSEKPKTIGAIAEIMEPLPTGFVELGIEAKQGISEHKTSLLNSIDQSIREVVAGMMDLYQNSLGQLKQLHNHLIESLNQSESISKDQQEQLFPEVRAQIDNLKEISISSLEECKNNIIWQLEEKSDEAILVLQDADNADPDAVREFGDAILSFLELTALDTTYALDEGAQSMTDKAQELEIFTDDALTTTANQVDQVISDFIQDADANLQTFIEGYEEGLTSTFDGLVNSLGELTEQVENQLNSSVEDLSTDMENTISEAEEQLIEAMAEGLAKNEEALDEMDSKMEDAAQDAAWRHDHPVRARLADIGAFIGGLVVGILAVLALVVIVIVAFKLIVAGLVALGVSLAVAKLVVLAAGLALLAYGIYQTYQARIDRGEEGGWGTFGLALLDITGITTIYQGLTGEGLSAFERGYMIGQGIATLATFFVGRRLNKNISSRLPRSITNPTRGSFLNRFRSSKHPTSAPPKRPTPGLETRGYRPKPGERTTSRQQYNQQQSQRRLNERLRREAQQSRKTAEQHLQSPQHAQNRAAAWGRYKGKLSYQEWSKRYDTLVRNRLVGKLTEEAFRKLTRGKPRTERIQVNGKWRTRYIDSARGNIAQEIKSGPLRNNDFTRNQILKDIALINQRGYRVEWHLFKGGDQNLINFMRGNGITVYIY